MNPVIVVFMFVFFVLVFVFPNMSQSGGSPSKCFSCEREDPLRSYPTKCFSCEAQLNSV